MERALKNLRVALSDCGAGNAEAQDVTSSQNLQETLTETISLLESQLPANPASPSAERAAKRVEREMRDYFKTLEDAMPLEELEMIYYRYAETG